MQLLVQVLSTLVVVAFILWLALVAYGKLVKGSNSKPDGKRRPGDFTEGGSGGD